MKNIENGRAWGIIANSVYANACVIGAMAASKEVCASIAAATGRKPDDFIINSTGVIGERLPSDIVAKAVPDLVAALSRDSSSAAEAILTTDTVTKEAAVRTEIGGVPVTIGGMAKGSGMIHPNMATMFAFVTTDCVISHDMLKKALSASVRKTYNRISVDGDTSTNDMTAILASCAAGNAPIVSDGEDLTRFQNALDTVNLELAKKIARDGEGATKLISCKVTGAISEEVAVTLGKSVISSSLVKAMMFGRDANVGRVLCALGYAAAPLNTAEIEIAFKSRHGRIVVCEKGRKLPFDEELAKGILSDEEVAICVKLRDGDGCAEAYGCDLTYDYVKINGDYRS
jgi:glutamate N-acetyltransferase/amino-acid N-acetyltransferase